MHQLKRFAWRIRRLLALWLGPAKRISTHSKPSNTARKKQKLKVYRDRNGEIRKVRIGRWRVVSSKPQRRIADFRQIDDGHRIALLIELADPFGMPPGRTVWEFYDRTGKLESMLQSTDDSGLWIQTRCQPQATPANLYPSSGESSFQIPAWT